MNEASAPSERVTLVFLNGRLHKFKKRYGLRWIFMHCEKTSADTSAAARVLPETWEMLSEYSPKNIFNADKYGLQFKFSPDSNISHRQLSGHKKDKSRKTCLACYNSTFYDVYPLPLIGRVKCSHAFNKKSADQLGIDNRFNGKSSIIRVFFEWLWNFNSS